MVQSQIVHRIAPTTCYQKPKKSARNVKISKSPLKPEAPKSSQRPTKQATSLAQEKSNDATKASKTEEQIPEEIRPLTVSLVEDIKRRRREERLAREKQAEEERERFIKETAERKAAEREEIVKQAKRLILYRKPMCRRINGALLASECYRELSAQIKFRETLKNVDKEEEIAYVKSIKEDVAKYEEEKKQNAEKEIEKRKKYAVMLKKQIEEIEESARAKENEEFEAEKQDQINTTEYLQNMKEYEAQKLLNKKQKLKQFFKDAIEEKKQFELKLKYEDEIEDRAIGIYQNAKSQMKKLHKEVALKEKEERERRSQLIVEQHRAYMKSPEEMEEKILQKALEEQEEDYKEKERARRERKDRMRKELLEFHERTTTEKLKQIREEKDAKAWEMMQRFKKVEYDKLREVEERRQEWNKKMEYMNTLQRDISKNEAKREQEKILEDDAVNMKKLMEVENQRILNYAEEVLNESKGVRPLYPILKAVEECKREMGLIPTKKREDNGHSTKKKT